MNPTDVMMGEALEHAEATYPEEACGVFFYPDRRQASGNGRPTVPQFVKIPNTAEDRTSSFEFDYDTMARNIGIAYWGTPAGVIQLWHSHPDDSGPSQEDYEMVVALADAMVDHPLWGLTPSHVLLSVTSGEWWDYTATVSENLTRTY